MRKAFEVYIRDRHYDVYDIPGKEHEGWNDVPKTWWLHYNRSQLGRVLEAPSPDDTELIPYHVSIPRLVWEVTFQQRTSCKYKWGGESFSASTWCVLACNGRKVYEFGAGGSDRGFTYAMAKAQALMVELCEHPYNFLDQESERGRKIYYHGLPATVSPSSPGEIGIVPDYTCGLDKGAWWSELKRRKSKFGKVADAWDDVFDDAEEERKEDDYINWGSALSDQHIDWFRD